MQTDAHADVPPGEEVALELTRGQSVTFALSVADRQPLVFVDSASAFGLLEETDRWWREWAARVTYGGPFAEAVIRSLIALRLLTYSPSGAPVAAPTTSLPEVIGGSRNWDYRFSWPRDAAIGVSAFLACGLGEEAHSFLHWLLVASRLTRPRLHVAYTLDGKPGLKEEELADVPGYGDSRPVRLGNAAAEQHQLDVYGWVVDAAWAMSRAGQGLHRPMRRAVRGFADFVADHWQEPDAGIWELREDPAHYVHSKLMAWLALDRTIRMAMSWKRERKRIPRWKGQRDRLGRDIRERGFDANHQCYVRSFGSNELDASVLVLPVLEFEAPDSPRVAGTIEAIRHELSAGGPLLYRYPPASDGLEGVEGAFLPCSFWLVLALARAGRLGEAISLFEDLCGLANDVGLFAEEMDPSTHEPLGNFPQALTHAGLIQAALALGGPNGG